jgi:Mg2+ and Co2+ transporter CorA
MATDNQNKANQAEVAATQNLEVVLELTPAQHEALKLMDKSDDIKSIAKSALDARIKGAFKYYAERIEKNAAELYDNSSRRGAKWDISKDEYLKLAVQTVSSVMQKL